LVNAPNQCLHHLALCLKESHLTVLLLLKFLLHVKGPWFLVEFAHNSELVNFGGICGAILVDVLVNQATHHGDLVRIVCRTGRLEAEGQSRHRR